MIRKKIFLASSSELKEDRVQFELFISRKNKEWIDKGVFLEVVLWEDFIDAMSPTRLQDEYNKSILECDIFLMMFFTKVGQYTEEEFEIAFGQFEETNKPLIYTYFKHGEISTGSIKKEDLSSLWGFQEKLKTLGHFYTVYENIDDLKFKFDQQLAKLAATGAIGQEEKPSPPSRDKEALERAICERVEAKVLRWSVGIATVIGEATRHLYAARVERLECRSLIGSLPYQHPAISNPD